MPDKMVSTFLCQNSEAKAAFFIFYFFSIENIYLVIMPLASVSLLPECERMREKQVYDLAENLRSVSQIDITIISYKIASRHFTCYFNN